MSDAIRVALSKLDPKNDDHWTEDGLPLIDALALKTAPTRAEVTAAAPTFTRKTPSFSAPKEKAKDAITTAGEQPITEDAITEEPNVDPTEELALLKLELDDAQAELDGLHKQIADAQAKLTVAQDKQRSIVIKMERKRHHERENMAGIQSVLEANKREREAAAGLATALRKTGISPAMFSPGSPIDNAMARRTQRGTQRPNFSARPQG